MTDKEILEEVYNIARTHMDRAGHESVHNHTAKLIASFIEEEWQRADELDDHPLTKSDEGQMYNMNEQDVNENSAGGGAHGYFSSSWYEKSNEVSKIFKMPDGYSVDQGGALDERHRGLEISEDGTVKGLTDE